MAESHSKGEQRHRPIAAAAADGRSAMTRASDGRPFRPYVYGGGDREPAAVTATRERHRALNDQIERAREAAAQRQRERGEALTAPQEALAAVPGPRTPDPAPAPPPVTAASRCGRCGYLTTAAGHQVTCDE